MRMSVGNHVIKDICGVAEVAQRTFGALVMCGRQIKCISVNNECSNCTRRGILQNTYMDMLK